MARRPRLALLGTVASAQGTIPANRCDGEELERWEESRGLPVPAVALRLLVEELQLALQASVEAPRCRRSELDEGECEYV